jgi:hypothetical protein
MFQLPVGGVDCLGIFIFGEGFVNFLTETLPVPNPAPTPPKSFNTKAEESAFKAKLKDWESQQRKPKHCNLLSTLISSLFVP